MGLLDGRVTSVTLFLGVNAARAAAERLAESRE